MALALTSRRVPMDPAEAARLHFVLRFSLGTTAAFVICEWMGWQPSALAPVLTGVLLANLPVAPPPKVGLALVLVMAFGAWLAFVLTSLFDESPQILFGLLGLIMFLAFAGLAQAKAQLPLTLLLICIGVLPVVMLTVPQAASRLPAIFVRAIGLAVIFTWIAFAFWPRPSPKPPDPPTGAVQSPIAVAAAGTAIVLPLMLIYLMFGLTDAMPVLLTTILLVAKMEEERGSATASAKLIGNFLGGFIAIAGYYVLNVAPSLATLGLITFLIGVAFAVQIVKGGAWGGNALLAYNATMIIFGLAILKGPSNSGTWGARVVQFAIACIFAVGMMRLLLPRARTRRPQES